MPSGTPPALPCRRRRCAPYRPVGLGAGWLGVALNDHLGRAPAAAVRTLVVRAREDLQLIDEATVLVHDDTPGAQHG